METELAQYNWPTEKHPPLRWKHRIIWVLTNNPKNFDWIISQRKRESETETDTHNKKVKNPSHVQLCLCSLERERERKLSETRLYNLISFAKFQYLPTILYTFSHSETSSIFLCLFSLSVFLAWVMDCERWECESDLTWYKKIANFLTF